MEQSRGKTHAVEKVAGSTSLPVTGGPADLELLAAAKSACSSSVLDSTTGGGRFQAKGLIWSDLQFPPTPPEWSGTPPSVRSSLLFLPFTER